MTMDDGIAAGCATAKAMISSVAAAPVNPVISSRRLPIRSMRNSATTVVRRLTEPTPTVASTCVPTLSKPAPSKIWGA